MRAISPVAPRGLTAIHRDTPSRTPTYWETPTVVKRRAGCQVAGSVSVQRAGVSGGAGNWMGGRGAGGGEKSGFASDYQHHNKDAAVRQLNKRQERCPAILFYRTMHRQEGILLE